MKKRKKATLSDLVRVMAKLRAPGGCPWDRKQTHGSLIKYLKEESQETIEAIKQNDMENLEEELGDVLLQILFHSQIASERGDFDMGDVLTTLKHKLVNRHPHVFDHRQKNKNLSAEDVVNRWKVLKANDKKKRKTLRKRQ